MFTCYFNLLGSISSVSSMTVYRMALGPGRDYTRVGLSGHGYHASLSMAPGPCIDYTQVGLSGHHRADTGQSASTASIHLWASALPLPPFARSCQSSRAVGDPGPSLWGRNSIQGRLQAQKTTGKRTFS